MTDSSDGGKNPSKFRKGLADGLRAPGKKIAGEIPYDESSSIDNETILVSGFPNLFGCAKHKPDSTELLLWSTPLSPEFEERQTFAHGRTWSLSVDVSYEDATYVIIDLTWAANTLREMGVVISQDPLVAVQTWNDFAALTETDHCDACLARCHRLDEIFIAHFEGDEQERLADLPPVPKLRWSDPPEKIAAAVLNDLRARSILGEALTVLPATAKWDLLPDVPTFLQLALMQEGALRIEARRDFSYWKTEVDDERVNRLFAAGFSDVSPWGVFEILHGPDPHGIFHEEVLTEALIGFIEVYEPRPKKIKIERLEGPSPFETPADRNFPFFQRLIDRSFRMEILSASRERLSEIDNPSEILLLELIETVSPEFARIIKLAHLEEFINTMDELIVLAPVGFDERMRDMAHDPFTNPEDLSDFVLRHIIQTSNMRERFIENEDRPSNEVVLDVQSLAHEQLLIGTEDDVPISVNGVPLDSDAALEADNGVVVPYPGWIDPPILPGLVIPDLN